MKDVEDEEDEEEEIASELEQDSGSSFDVCGFYTD